MILYHGTNMAFDAIDLTASKPNKDFGRGFYLTPDFEQAMNMARIKTEQRQEGTPIVMEYEVSESEMNALRVLQFKDYDEAWAKFILANRNNPADLPVHDYDIVIGPIANDRVGVQLWRYESQLIDLPTLINRLKYMKGMTIQYYFGTSKAVSILKRIR